MSHSPVPAPPYDAGAEPAEAVLDLVPESATTITVTDWDQVRVQLGLPDLTSESLMTDRNAFWERERTESAALTEGMLREGSSELELDYGFTQDDVDWEAHWTGPDGQGWALAFRPDLDLDPVQLAIRQGVEPLAGGRLQEERHLVVSGTSDVDVWGSDPQWSGLVSEPATATFLRRGCLPLNDALGPDATSEDQDRLLAEHHISFTLDDLAGFAIAFGDHTATVRVEPGRADLFERLHIGQDWPVEGFEQAWRSPVGDPSTGRIGYTLPDPPRAVGYALLEELPFALCSEVVPLEEPTG